MKKYGWLLLPLVLAACTPHGDLRTWMNEEKANAAKTALKPRPVEPLVYTEYVPPLFSGLNSFDANRLSLARKGDVGPNAPDFNRPKEILEGFGLDRVQYVGSLHKNGQWLGFVRVEGHVYTVKTGNHIGSDYGVITQITPDKIVLQETVQNTEGEWVHRPAEIMLVTN